MSTRPYKGLPWRIAAGQTKATRQIGSLIRRTIVFIVFIIAYFITAKQSVKGFSEESPTERIFIAATAIAFFVAASDVLFCFLLDERKNASPEDKQKSVERHSGIGMFGRTWIAVFATTSGLFILSQFVSALPSYVANYVANPPSAPAAQTADTWGGGTKNMPMQGSLSGQKADLNPITGQGSLNGQYMIVNVEGTHRAQSGQSGVKPKTAQTKAPCCETCPRPLNGRESGGEQSLSCKNN